MKRVFCLYALAVVTIFASPAFGTTVYKWVDPQGVMNFTDDPNKVPAELRSRVETKVFEEAAGKSAVPPPQPFLQERKERKTDIYGLGETWWKDRVRPWKEQLKEATENYERVNQRFIEEAEDLTRFKYGSRTQVKSRVIEMDRINDERIKYGEQVEEASQMLDKLAKEAAEAKADPVWLQ